MMHPFRTHRPAATLGRWARLTLLALLVFGLTPLPELTQDIATSTIQTVDAKNTSRNTRRSAAKESSRAAKPAPKCQFTKSASVWTLRSDCTTSETILIPAGVTLKGAGKTITMQGPVNGFARRVQVSRFGQGIPQFVRVAAAVLANGGVVTVENLAIKGGNLDASQGCPAFPTGLAYINTAGAIRGVTVEDIRAANCGFAGFSPGIGISALGGGGQTVAMENVAVRRVGSTGVQVNNVFNTAGMTANIAGATVADAGTGVVLEAGSLRDAVITDTLEFATGVFLGSAGRSTAIDDVSVRGTYGTGIYAIGGDIDIDGFAFQTVTPGALGIFFDSDPALSATIANSTIEDVFGGIGQCVGTMDVSDTDISGVQGFGTYAIDCYGFGPVTAAVLDTSIDRGAPAADPANGLVYDAGAQGSASGNAISNFTDTNPDAASCGIALFPGSGEVTGVAENDFSGNEQDICDFQAAARSRSTAGPAFDRTALDEARERLEAAGLDIPEAMGQNARGKDDGKGRDRRGKDRGKRGRR